MKSRRGEAVGNRVWKISQVTSRPPRPHISGEGTSFSLQPSAFSILLHGLFFLVVLTLPLRVQWLVYDQRLAPIYYEYTSIIFYLSDAAVLPFVLGVAVWYGWKRPSFSFSPPYILIPLGLLPVLSLISAYWAKAPSLAAYLAVRLEVLWWLVLAVAVLRPSRRFIQWSVAASLLLQSAVAMGQFVRQQDLGLQFLGEFDLAAVAGRSLSIIPVGEQLWLRAYGLTPHPNILGGILMAFLLALAPAYVQSQGWRKVGWLGILLIGVGALAVTFSRSAWLGLAAGGLFFLGGIVWQPSWRKEYGRSLLGPMLASLFLLTLFVYTQRDLLLSRLTSPVSYIESRSLDERQALNAVALYFIRQQPFLGVGGGNFAVAYQLLDSSVRQQLIGEAAVSAHPVHNIPLLVISETGILGGVLWLGLLAVPPLMTIWRARDGRITLWKWGMTAVLIALAVADLFDFYSWGWPQGRLLRWFCFALYCLD